MHVIIVLENPYNDPVRYILAREFIERMKNESDVILYIVELSYLNQDFYITTRDNVRHLQLKYNDAPIWHKENLINLGVEKLLPKEWKAFAWIDADVEFESSSWASDTLKILNGSKDIVQLFSHAIFMDKNGDTDTIFTGFGYQYSKKMKWGNSVKDPNSFWHSGFAWACTRKFYNKIGKLYPFDITGDGDMHMAIALISNIKHVYSKDNMTDDFMKSFLIFEEKAYKSRLGYVPTVIRHHFHGTINSRKYAERGIILIECQYSPSKHLIYDEHGILHPSPDMPKKLLERIDKLNTKDFNILDYLDNCKVVVINLERNVDRLESCTEEIKKIGLDINADYCLKLNATDYKNKQMLETDLNEILSFLRQFNDNIPDKYVTIDEFSETNDANINIYNGSLGCLISHLRALKYAYENSTDLIIIEDDIKIDSVANIPPAIFKIKGKYDIITMNAQNASGTLYRTDDVVYKFRYTFYHLHFYILKKECYSTIFKNIYPFTDQYDILLGNMNNKLNIYNITGTMSQKNFITNSQNDILLLRGTPVYKQVFIQLDHVKNALYKLGVTSDRIANKILDEIIFENIFYINSIPSGSTFINEEKSLKELIENELITEIYILISLFIKNRDKDVYSLSCRLLKEINELLSCFKIDADLNVECYSFGSTSNIYISDSQEIIEKKYNDKFRWKIDCHKDKKDIYEKELYYLLKLGSPKYNNIFPRVLDYNLENYSIKMSYNGESLYNYFNLPLNYAEQIQNIFDIFTKNLIDYREFNLNNILVKNDIICFIDFGLAIDLNLDCENPNIENSRVFIHLLTLLSRKLSIGKCTRDNQILYHVFLNNIRSSKKYSRNVF